MYILGPLEIHCVTSYTNTLGSICGSVCIINIIADVGEASQHTPELFLYTAFGVPSSFHGRQPPLTEVAGIHQQVRVLNWSTSSTVSDVDSSSCHVLEGLTTRTRRSQVQTTTAILE